MQLRVAVSDNFYVQFGSHFPEFAYVSSEFAVIQVLFNCRTMNLSRCQATFEDSSQTFLLRDNLQAKQSLSKVPPPFQSKNHQTQPYIRSTPEHHRGEFMNFPKFQSFKVSRSSF
jgi:hypothetical protein